MKKTNKKTTKKSAPASLRSNEKTAMLRVRMSPADFQSLKELAHAEDLPMAIVVRKLVREAVAAKASS